MKKGLSIYIVLLISILSLSALVFGLYYQFGQTYYPVYFPVIPITYILIGIHPCRLISKYAETNEIPSLSSMMLSRLLKIIFSLCVLVVGILLDKTHAVNFVILFVIYYIFYLIFETKLMIKLNKTK